MKRLSGQIFGVLLSGVFATIAIAAEPTTLPIAHGIPRVEVFSFSAVSGVAPTDWTGRGIQEQLQSDVSRSGATLMLAPHAVGGDEDFIATAKANHADLAVTGSYQVVGDQIRANGHLIEVSTNSTIGGFSATGSQHDLFKVEDALGEQLRALLPKPISADQIRQAFDQPQQPVVSQEFLNPVYSQPATVNNYYDSSPAPTYYYPDYGYDYSAYPYGLGFGGGLGFYYGGGFYNRGGHDHGFDRGFEGHRAFTAGPTVRSPAFRGGGGSIGGFSSHAGGGLHLGGGGGHGGGGGRR